MAKAPTPKSDALREMRERNYQQRQAALREAKAAAAAEKPKPVKRRKAKEK